MSHLPKHVRALFEYSSIPFISYYLALVNVYDYTMSTRFHENHPRALFGLEHQLRFVAKLDDIQLLDSHFDTQQLDSWLAEDKALDELKENGR